MLYIQIKEILDYTRKVDEAISKVYEKFADTSKNDLAKQLSEYLGRHYKRISESMANMSDEEHKTLLEKHVPYGPQPADFQRLEKLDLDPEATVDDLLDAAIDVDRKLVELFKTVLENPVDTEVREFFESLIKYEEGDEEKLRQIKAYY